jgi:hypothetical protein
METALLKMKSINHKGHKGFSQRTQSEELKDFDFVYFVHSLRSLWLKRFLNSHIYNK